jgi:hypothetical protein
MLKKFSAALIAASLLAAPALAAGPAARDTIKNPIAATATAPTIKPVASVDGKLHATSPRTKASLLNANARMVRHQHHHARHHHHFHKKTGALHFQKHAASHKSTVAHFKRG